MDKNIVERGENAGKQNLLLFVKSPPPGTFKYDIVLVNPSTHTILILKDHEKVLKNIVGKGQNASQQNSILS